jgi:hypothetical protein
VRLPHLPTPEEASGVQPVKLRATVEPGGHWSSWHVQDEDQRNVYSIRLTISATLRGTWYVIRADGTVADHGTFSFHAWNEESAREVVSLILARVAPDAEVEIDTSQP